MRAANPPEAIADAAAGTRTVLPDRQFVTYRPDGQPPPMFIIADAISLSYRPSTALSAATRAILKSARKPYLAIDPTVVVGGIDHTMMDAATHRFADN